MSINLKELARRVASTNDLTITRAEEIIRDTLGVIKDSVTEGETVDLHEFGKFELVHKPGRTARNPATGAPVEVPPKKVATFTVAKAFREQVNS